MLTKKAFESIQSALRDGYGATIAITGPLRASNRSKLDQSYVSTCRAIAKVLAGQSAKFQAVKFMRGCGIQEDGSVSTEPEEVTRQVR